MSTAHELVFNGGLLQRGFWLYIWEITTLEYRLFCYVGRTGDSSSLNAQSPFNRMGQHLGFRKEGNALRRHLAEKDLTPESCTFRLVAYGPILSEAKTRDEHRKRRNQIAAMEKALADIMRAGGFDVLNTVNSKKPLDEAAFQKTREAFEEQFPGLKARGESVK